MNAHFVVTGEFITQTARAFWNDECEPEKAMSLMESLHGISKDQILSVLDGRCKLVGTSDTGVTLEPDGSYRGKSFQQVMREMRERTDAAEDERADMAQMTARDVVLVASPTGRRLIPRRKAQRTRGTLYSCMTLRDGYEFDDLMSEAKPGDKPQRIWEALDVGGNDAPVQMMDVMDNVERIRKGDRTPPPTVVREPEEEKPPPPPKAHKRISYHTGWLSPEGKFYPCRHAQHARTAWSLGLTDNPYNHSIEVDGWARLGEIGDRQYFFGEHTLFNDTVNQMIKGYCKRKKIELPFWLDKEPK